MAVRTPRSVVAHLLRAAHCALMRRDAPLFSAIHGPVLDVLVSARVGLLLRVQRIAHLGNRLDDVARVRRRRAPREEVVVGLAAVRPKVRELWAVVESGAHGERGRSVQPRGEGYPGYPGYPGYHGECGGPTCARKAALNSSGSAQPSTERSFRVSRSDPGAFYSGRAYRAWCQVE
jgi:hypothetical protein